MVEEVPEESFVCGDLSLYLAVDNVQPRLGVLDEIVLGHRLTFPLLLSIVSEEVVGDDVPRQKQHDH